MKKYLFFQFLQRLLYFVAIIGLFVVIGYFVWYLLSKPKQSKITLTDYSQIIFDDLDCNNLNPLSTPVANQFPLFLSYQQNQAGINLRTDKDYYLSTLKISNAVQVFVTTQKKLNGKDTSETTLLPQNKNLIIEIKAKRFRWSSQIASGQFDEVKGLLPQVAPTPTNNTYCDLDECYYDEPPGEFDWIPNNPAFIYNIGVCGENLKYLPRFESATLDDLYSLGVDIVPVSQDETAFMLSFDNLVDIKSEGISIPIGEEADVRIILRPSSSSEGDGDLETSDYTPSIRLVFTELTDEIIYVRDSSTGASPGLNTLINNERFLERQNEGREISRYHSLGLISVNFKADRIFVDSPSGSVMANSPKVLLPESADQMIVYSTSNPIEFSFKDFSYFTNKYEVVGERIGALVDGREYLPSPWESIPREIQVALITVLFPILAAIIGYGIQKQKSIDEFFDWLFSIPRYRRPVKLHDAAHIFHLTNGKKISGSIDTFEGKSTFRVFVLKEVREWDKDNWSEVLPTEVRVPQNQIEMYYKAHP